MQIDIMSFTRRGIELSAKIRECLYSCGKGYEVCLYTKYGRYQEISDAEIQTEWIREHNRANGKNPVYVKESIYDWMRARFEQNRNGKKTAVIWIGACGIAVRAMAPSLRDKLTSRFWWWTRRDSLLSRFCPDIMAEQMNLQDCLQNGSVQCLS